MKNKSPASDANRKQVRGPELREKIMDSEAYGEEYRKSHQGQDVRDTRIQHSVDKNETKDDKNK
jgi:hypothetical protein